MLLNGHLISKYNTGTSAEISKSEKWNAAQNSIFLIYKIQYWFIFLKRVSMHFSLSFIMYRKTGFFYLPVCVLFDPKWCWTFKIKINVQIRYRWSVNGRKCQHRSALRFINTETSLGMLNQQAFLQRKEVFKLTRYSKTRVREHFVWMISWRVTMFACLRFFSKETARQKDGSISHSE